MGIDHESRRSVIMSEQRPGKERLCVCCPVDGGF